MVIREKPLIFGHTQPKALPTRTVRIMQWSSMGLSSVLLRTHISVQGFFPKLRFAICDQIKIHGDFDRSYRFTSGCDPFILQSCQGSNAAADTDGAACGKSAVDIKFMFRCRLPWHNIRLDRLSHIDCHSKTTLTRTTSTEP